VTPNQYRCETCQKRAGKLICNTFVNETNGDISGVLWSTSIIGCASHSDFQSERDNYICTGEGYDPEDKYCQRCYARQRCPVEKEDNPQSERDEVLDDVLDKVHIKLSLEYNYVDEDELSKIFKEIREELRHKAGE
jgi:hypothetical protein